MEPGGKTGRFGEGAAALFVRRARPSDAEALRDLYHRHLTQVPTEDGEPLERWRRLLQEFLEDERYYLLVGEAENRVVASVTLVVVPNLTHGIRPYALIENVVTHGSYRNRGYASALIGRACEIAAEADCYKVMLMTGSKREETLRFYENCGFDGTAKTAFLKKL